MKFCKRITLFLLFFTIFANSPAQAGWSFSSLRETISSYFTLERAQKQIEETFKNKWAFAAAGLVLIPTVIYGLSYLKNKWAKKQNTDERKPNKPIPNPDEKKPENISTVDTTVKNPLVEIVVDTANASSSDSESDEHSLPIPPPSSQLPNNPPVEPIQEKPSDDSSSAIEAASPRLEEPSPQALPSASNKNEMQPAQRESSNDEEMQPPQDREDSYIEIKALEKQQPSASLATSQKLEDSSLSNSWIQITLPKKEGCTIYQQIIAKTYQMPKDKSNQLENLVDVIHYFFDIAKKKDQAFTEGTIVIDDPENKIYTTFIDYVKNCYKSDLNKEIMFTMSDEAYPRRSSHYNDYSKQSNQAQKPPHYGIDTNDQVRLPLEQMHHILFGKINDKQMFIRMEPHGLQGLNVFGHTIGYCGSLGRKFLPILFGSDVGEQLRKERVPAEELKQFSELVKDIEAEKQEQLVTCAKGLGIQFMYQKIQDYVSNPTNPTDSNGWQKPAAEFISTLEQKYDYIKNRVGNEVILKLEDLKQH